MRGLILLFTGFFLLRGSVLPVISIAQAETAANTQEKRAAAYVVLVRPKKRDPMLTLKAIHAVKKRESASLADMKQTTSLLSVVDQNDIRIRHRELANETLRALPQECQSSLKHFYVRYDNPKRRGLAGKSTIILSGNVPDEEFKALLIHEFGHITDLGCLQGNAAAEPSAFRDGSEIIYLNDPSVSFYSISWVDSKHKRKDSKPEDFVSGYAAWDPFEDFAETYAYFTLQNNTFRKRARRNPILAAKYRWMSYFVFKNQTQIAAGGHEWNGEVPWDVTKLAYEWYSPARLASTGN